MKITVERFESTPDETFGRLLIDGKKICLTLEDEYRAIKVKGETRIPAGTYKIGLVNSPKFTPKYGHEMLWVKNVPNFEGILIHCGNTDEDTAGCLLVGENVGVINTKSGPKRGVIRSREAYNKIYPIISSAIKRGEDVEITYIDLK
jgi:hypothetical protein